MKIDFPDLNEDRKPLRTCANLKALCEAHGWIMERDGFGNKKIQHPEHGYSVVWRGSNVSECKLGSPMIDALEHSGLPHETVAFHFYALNLDKEKRPDLAQD